MSKLKKTKNKKSQKKYKPSQSSILDIMKAKANNGDIKAIRFVESLEK